MGKRTFIKKILMRIIFLLICGMPFMLGTEAKAQTKESETGRTIKIGYIDYEGLFNLNEDGTMEGYGAELLDKISEYTGWKYEYVFDTWDNLLSRLAKGDIDFVMNAQRTKEREKKYIFSEYSTGSETNLCYVRQGDNRFYYEDYDHFDGMTVGMLKGSFTNGKFEQYAKSKGFSYKAKYYDNVSEAYEKLKAGEIDSAAVGSLSGVGGFKVVSRFGSDPFYFMTAKKNTDLKATIDDAMSQILSLNSSYTTDLFDKYYGETAANTDLRLTREEAAYVAGKPVITVGLLPNRNPISYEEEGTAKGIAVDIMKHIGEVTGVTIHFDFLKMGESSVDYFARTGNELVAGVMESEFSTIDDSLTKSNPLLLTSAVFVGRKSETIDLNKGMKIAITPQFLKGENKLATKFPKCTLCQYENIEDSYQGIENGEADVIMQNVYVARSYLENPRYDNLAVYQAYWYDEKMIAVCEPDNGILASLVNKAMTVIPDSDVSKIVVNNTTGTSNTLSFSDFIYVYRVPLVILISSIFVLCVIIIYIFQMRQRNLKRMEQVNEQLKELAVKEQRANAAKTDFMSRMSHDMRTPMNGILGMAELIQHKSDLKEIRYDVDQIKISGNYLLNLINDTLDMNKIEAGRLELHPKPINSEDLFKNVLTNVKGLIGNKKIDFTVKLPDTVENGWVAVVADASRVEQIFMNLISNAVKYTPEGGKVEVELQTLEITDTQVVDRYMIKDTGVGMSEEFIPHIFEPFSQEGRINTDRESSTGLGMPIVKQLVELMDGEIDIQSELNKGTQVSVILRYPIYNGEMVKQPEEEKDEETLSGKRILVCEDHPLNMEITTKLLERKGILVEGASNGEEGVAMMAKSSENYYDCILMDVRMPVMNGIEATKAIRRLVRKDVDKIPIIAMTANAFDADVEQCIRAGMNEHLSKPVIPEKLYKTLIDFVG